MEHKSANRDLPYFNHDGDWFDLGLVQVTWSKQYGYEVVTTREFTIPQSVSAGQFTHPVTDSNIINGPPEQTAYLVTASNGIVYDLKPTWIGMMNHAPPGRANMYAFGTYIVPYSGYTFKKGERLTWDYSRDYWVFQLTSLEADEFSSIPGATYVFNEMHERVVDYGKLIKMKLYQFSKIEIVQKIRLYLESFDDSSNFIFSNTKLNGSIQQQQQREFKKRKFPRLYNTLGLSQKRSKRNRTIISNTAPNNKISYLPLSSKEIALTKQIFLPNALFEYILKQYYLTNDNKQP